MERYRNRYDSRRYDNRYDDVAWQRHISRESDYENYDPYPAMDDHYRMYRDWNDNAYYGSYRNEGRDDDSGRTGYMRWRDDRDRTHISEYGYRNVGDRANYGHSGTNDPYDPRQYDRGRSMYGMGAGTYLNGRRDEEMRYDSRNDWNVPRYDPEWDYRQSYEQDERRRYR